MAMMALTYSAIAQNADKLLGEYLEVKDALVNGNSSGATRALGVFLQTLKSETDFTEKKALIKATEKMLKSSDLEGQRSRFNDLSVVMWKVVKKSKLVSGPVYYQYCPMKKAYWISKEKEIKNPYYGSSMLSCGKVVETKN